MAVAAKAAAVNPVAVQVGERLRALRHTRGMKQDTLAREAGYSSRAAIAQFENGFAVPSLDKALLLARALGVHIGELLGETRTDADVPDQEARRLATWAEARCHALAITLRAFANELEAFSTHV